MWSDAQAQWAEWNPLSSVAASVPVAAPTCDDAVVGRMCAGTSCDYDEECESGACRDWGNHDKRCCPTSDNRWDQCNHLPLEGNCKNWDGSQCESGRCHDVKCSSLPPLSQVFNPFYHLRQAAMGWLPYLLGMAGVYLLVSEMSKPDEPRRRRRRRAKPYRR